jgi:hypothetical protein
VENMFNEYLLNYSNISLPIARNFPERIKIKVCVEISLDVKYDE